MSEILAFSESPILIQSFQNQFPNRDIIQPLMYHPKLQLRNQIPLKQKPFHLRKKKKNAYTDFSSEDFKSSDDSEKIRLPEKKVSTTTFSIQ